jgi:hypothetical protein
MSLLPGPSPIVKVEKYISEVQAPMRQIITHSSRIMVRMMASRGVLTAGHGLQIIVGAQHSPHI